MYDTEGGEGFGVSEKSPESCKIEEADVQVVPSHGKGSHGTLYVGPDGRTTVQDLKREVPTGTLRAMIDQLGLEPEDFGLK